MVKIPWAAKPKREQPYGLIPPGVITCTELLVFSFALWRRNGKFVRS